MLLADGRSRQPNGSCAASDQQTLYFFETQRLEQRTPRRLQHLGDRSERFPRKFGLDDLHLFRGHTRVFGVAAVKLPAQSAHRCRDDIALAKLASGRCLDHTDGLDTQDTRKLNTGRMALPGKQLGPVEPECPSRESKLRTSLVRGSG